MDNQPEGSNVPTYDEAFPSLPELDETRKILAEAHKSTWAAAAIKPTQTTQVNSYFRVGSIVECEWTFFPSSRRFFFR